MTRQHSGRRPAPQPVTSGTRPLLIPRPDLPADRLAIVVKHAASKDADFDMATHAASLGLPYEIYLARLEVARQNAEKRGGDRLIDFSLGKPWELDGDWMIIGDVHVPFTRYDFAQLVSLVGRKNNVKKLLIAGDFFNMDTFSTYAHLVTIPGWKEEREAAKRLLSEWLEVFDEVRMVMGNHDRRLQKFTAGELDEQDILALIISNPDKVKMNPFGWCTIKTETGDWRITHPKNYSINQLTVADTLAQKYQANIISFHEHHLGIGWDRYKRYVTVNGGCLVDPGKLAYVTLDDGKNSGMALGFVMLKNGVAQLFGETPFTDWQHWT